ncbi:glycosyltransferase family 2 protein [Marinimicrobium agarilyticum]|uniref:glycosyltransferase family 2 protein n=1 Tax=Marinimicrobium agarilyticum TaxID=306546 RepID=UPI0004288651|nr:glycosyltransferase family 2 protein [Marinimicrobium agarilyticum]
MDKTETDMPSTPPQPTRIDYDVVVCSYNGGAYIAEQLESILKQEPPARQILISDDGSTDNTRDIVKQLAETSPVPVTLIDGPRKGVIHNVLTALPQTTAEYVFLSDQDDIWLENKVALFSEHMRQSDDPHLIFSDAWVWHPGKEEMASFWKLDDLKPDNAKSPRKLAFHNTVQGASACFNRALINTINTEGAPSEVIMHDWWLALIASGTGRVSAIKEPTLLYRQHSSNQVGSQNSAGKKKRNIAKTLFIANRILCQAVAFSEHFRERLTPEDRAFFLAYENAMRGGTLKRLAFILRHRPTHKDLNRTCKLWASILLVKGARAQ